MTAMNPLLMEDIDFYRHWHPQSERFAGGDCLATALELGWVLKAPIIRDVYWCAGARRVNVYHCDLVRNDERLHMPALGNPYMDHLIQHMGLPVIVSEERKQFLLQSVAPAFEHVSV